MSNIPTPRLLKRAAVLQAFSRLDPEDRVEILEALSDTVPEPPKPKDSSFIRFEKRCQQAVPYVIAFMVLYIIGQLIRLAVTTK